MSSSDRGPWGPRNPKKKDLVEKPAAEKGPALVPQLLDKAKRHPWITGTAIAAVILVSSLQKSEETAPAATNATEAQDPVPATTQAVPTTMPNPSIERTKRLQDCVQGMLGLQRLQVSNAEFYDQSQNAIFTLATIDGAWKTTVVPVSLVHDDSMTWQMHEALPNNDRAFYTALEAVCVPYAYGLPRTDSLQRLQTVRFDAQKFVQGKPGL